MKLVYLLALLLLPIPAFGQTSYTRVPYSLQITQTQSDNSIGSPWYLYEPASAAHGVFVYDGDSRVPRITIFDPVFTYAGSSSTAPLSIDFTGLNLGDYGLGDLVTDSDLADVAFTGDYNDLTGLPSIPAAPVNADWTATSGLAVILNKPSLSSVAISGNYDDLTGKPALFSGAWEDISGKPTSFPPSSHSHSWSEITDIPSSFVPSAHTHSISDITGLQSALDAKLNTPSGTNAQYIRGDGTLATFPSNLSAFTNGPGYINQAGARAAVSLTTAGTGAASYNSSTGVLNIPTNSSSFALGAPTTGNTFSSAVAFQPRSGGPCALNVNASLGGGTLGLNGTAVISMSPTSGGSYTEVGRVKLLIAILGVGDDRDTGSIMVPAGWYVRIILTGGVTATYTKWDLN